MMTSWRLTETDVVLEKVAFSAPGENAAPRKIRHLFADRDRHAINAALAAGRPLLVRGEPGVGKSQLAAAAAVALDRRFVSRVIDARTESQDLLYTLDAVRRLADAQLVGVQGLKEGETLDDRLDASRYVTPGPLWWGFAWSGAHKQATHANALVDGTEPDAPCGVVVLLDEIDKADSSVPNGLLECLGQRRFPGPRGETILCTAMPPLVVVTTNEERSLPDAFLRRCVVLQMSVPATKNNELLEWLQRRGRAHFTPREIGDKVLDDAAAMLIEDREEAQRRHLPPPGGAEFLDLLRALFHLARDPDEQRQLLDELRDFTLRKHPEAAR